MTDEAGRGTMEEGTGSSMDINNIPEGGGAHNSKVAEDMGDRLGSMTLTAGAVGCGR